MSAVLIISIFLLGLATYAFLRSKRARSTEEPSGFLPPPTPPRGLFEAAEVETKTVVDAAADTRRELLERASRGDVDALREAHASGDRSLYNDVLDALVVHCAAVGAGALPHVGREIVGGDGLRANRSLALAMLSSWRESTAKTLTVTADLVRVAALSDDAETFRETIETVYRAWRGGELRVASPEELAALFENEYWILSPDARRSGAGFVLKRTLAELRRALSDESRRESPTVR